MKLTHLIVIGVICTTAGFARADNLEDAKAAFADGKRSFEAGDYNRALQQFTRANQLAPAPSLMYNIGRTYEKMGRFRDAVASYEQYLTLVGEPQSDDDRKLQEDLRKRIDEDRRIPDRAPNAPPPPTQPQPPVYQPQPYYYNPNPYPQTYNPYAYQVPLVSSREARLAEAKRKQKNGINAIIAGSILLAVGSGFIGGAAPLSNNFKVFDTSNGLGAAVLLTFGVMMDITGLIILPIGIANTVSGGNQYNKIMKEPQPVAPGQAFEPQAAPVPGQPQAWIFPLYTKTF